MGMDKIIDNVVPPKKAKVHTRKVCQLWYNNILRDQKLAFQMERSKYFRMFSAIRQPFYSNEFKEIKRWL